VDRALTVIIVGLLHRERTDDRRLCAITN